VGPSALPRKEKPGENTLRLFTHRTIVEKEKKELYHPNTGGGGRWHEKPAVNSLLFRISQEKRVTWAEKRKKWFSDLAPVKTLPRRKGSWKGKDR